VINVDLSDFPADELSRIRTDREATFEVEMKKYRDIERDNLTTAAESRREHSAAWASGRYFRAVLLWIRIHFGPTPELPQTPEMPAVTERERILEAGAAGQRAVVEHLAARLDDRWISLSGYFTFKGEVDIVLIGPGGVACIEVKTLNAEMKVDGEDWWRQFRGRNGQVVGAPTLVRDQGGRSPSRQVNEPAEHLRQWLRRHGIDLQIRRWVVLAHANSRIVQLRNLTVDAVMRTDELDVERLLGKENAAPLGREEVARIRQLVERDHKHHVERQAAGPHGGAQRVAVVAQDAMVDRRVAEREMGVPEELSSGLSRHRDAGGDAATSLHFRRVAQLAVRARLVAEVQGHDPEQRNKLRKAIAHDLLVRSEPTETPDLLEQLKHEPAAEVVLQLIDEVRQVFELDDRCLLAFAIPVAMRLRRFGERPFERSVASAESLDLLSHMLRSPLGVKRMVFDNRLYALGELATVRPKDWLRYLVDLEANSTGALPVIQPTTVTGRPDPRWEMTCLLGVAACDAAVAQEARGWTRIRLKRVFHEETEKALMSLRPNQWCGRRCERAEFWPVSKC
jgi:hypothetical protein